MEAGPRAHAHSFSCTLSSAERELHLPRQLGEHQHLEQPYPLLLGASQIGDIQGHTARGEDLSMAT